MNYSEILQLKKKYSIQLFWFLTIFEISFMLFFIYGYNTTNYQLHEQYNYNSLYVDKDSFISCSLLCDESEEIPERLNDYQLMELFYKNIQYLIGIVFMLSLWVKGD
jgi:uncharacterized protein with PQ loop repeat